MARIILLKIISVILAKLRLAFDEFLVCFSQLQKSADTQEDSN